MKNLGAKLLWTVIAILIAGLPTWFWLAIYSFTDPSGFWQKFLFVGIGLWVCGSLQFISVIALILFLFAVWSE